MEFHKYSNSLDFIPIALAMINHENRTLFFFSAPGGCLSRVLRIGAIYSIVIETNCLFIYVTLAACSLSRLIRAAGLTDSIFHQLLFMLISLLALVCFV